MDGVQSLQSRTVMAEAVTLTHHSLADSSNFQSPSSIHGAYPIQHTIFLIFSSHVYLLYCIFIVPFLCLAIYILSITLQLPVAFTAAAAAQAGSPGAAAARTAQGCGRRCHLGQVAPQCLHNDEITE